MSLVLHMAPLVCLSVDYALNQILIELRHGVALILFYGCYALYVIILRFVFNIVIYDILNLETLTSWFLLFINVPGIVFLHVVLVSNSTLKEILKDRTNQTSFVMEDDEVYSLQKKSLQ